MKTRPPMRTKLTGCLAIFVFILALLAAIALVNRRDQNVKVGEPIHYGDYSFSVESWNVLSSPANTYQIQFKVSGGADRLPREFYLQGITLSGDDGKMYHPTQINFPPQNLITGEQNTLTLEFTPPNTLQNPKMSINDGNSPLFGIIESIFHGNNQIKLEKN
ncbi:MAG: hypothetical protein ACKVS6_13665 [Planctomycetota bacterium]